MKISRSFVTFFSAFPISSPPHAINQLNYSTLALSSDPETERSFGSREPHRPLRWIVDVLFRAVAVGQYMPDVTAATAV